MSNSQHDFSNRVFTPCEKELNETEDPNKMSVEPRKLLKDDQRYFISASYENLAHVGLDDDRAHQYEDPVQLSRQILGKNPRKKSNVLYESNESLDHRVQKIRSLEHDAVSANSVEIVNGSDGLCTRFCCLIVTLISLAALALVLMILFGFLPLKNCACDKALEEATQGGNSQAVSSSQSAELEKRIDELKTNLSNLQQVLDILLQDKADSEKKIEALEISLNSSKEQIATLETALNQSSDKLMILEDSSNEIKKNANDLETTLNATADEVTTTNGKLQELENNVTLSMQELKSSLTNALQLGDMVVYGMLNSSITILQDKDTVIENMLSSLNANLSERITNVSKAEGPTGPQGSEGPAGVNGTQGLPGAQGAGNLSLCEHKRERIGSHMDSLSRNTNVEVTHTLDGSYVYTAVTCGNENAAETHTVYDKSTKKFKCICSGNPITGYSSTTKVYCSLYYWRCPLTS